MKKFILALCVSMAVVMMVTPVFAMELWDPHLRGVDEGLAAGALPPPGFYFINTFYMMPGLNSWSAGVVNKDAKLFVFVESPVLLWATGMKFLGADYAMAIAQPIVYTNLQVVTPLGTLAGNNWGTFNTLLVPYILSWKLPCDWHIKTALTVGLNDGSSNLSNTSLGGNPAKIFMAPSANDYYDFIPEVGISWLHNGWNISADLFFAIPLKDYYTNYQSGNQFSGDYTITKTIGKWTFGLGAASYYQVNSDTLMGVKVPNSQTQMYTVGPIIGYNFGPVSMQFVYNFAVSSDNQFGGDWCLLRMVVPLGNPCK
ncbi:MAG TPA: transporter [Deltaproteobacteria bacterium]|jgi:hypothetical protein|nr:transporter [Deltaproteobacteria bacterium]